MHIDQHTQYILSENDVCSLLMKGTIKHHSKIPVDFTIQHCDLIDPLPLTIPSTQSHNERIDSWKMPKEYLNLDIFEYVINKTPIENLDRVTTELLLYQEYKAENLLRYCVYLVDMFRKHNILWGVGRGSSTASYVLFLINIHRIDSVKYNLPLSDFFKNYDSNQII